MLLDKLQSGFLLLETSQGMVRVELSLRQRIYLLWTFRHFRQLSVLLLNSRERTLINGLFRNHATVGLNSIDPTLVIGMVENFVPATLPAPSSPQDAAERAPAQKPVEKDERHVLLPARNAGQPRPVRSSPKGRPILDWSRLATTRLATLAGALFLCVISVGAWHRFPAVSSQANNQIGLQPINAITISNSPYSAGRAGWVESPLAVASPEITAPLTPAPKTEVMQASVAADVPVHTAASISASISTAKQTIRDHAGTPARTLPLHDQNNGMNIEASRPPLRFAYPDYTDVRAHGIVSLTAGVDPTGAVRNVRFISGNRALAAAAARAIRQWRYRPYFKDDRAVATETNIVISFFSNDAISLSFPPSIATNR